MSDQCGICGGEKGSCPPGTKWPDRSGCAWASSSEFIVLPRAAVEELGEDIQGAYDASRQFETYATCSGLLDRFNALLAAAKGVESLGRHEALTDSGALPDGPQFYVDPSVPLSGFYEIFIAADAAEEGE